MYTNEKVLSALVSLCADQGQTLAEREVAAGHPAGYLSNVLSPPEAEQINRNIRLILQELNFSTDAFHQKMEETQ